MLLHVKPYLPGRLTWLATAVTMAACSKGGTPVDTDVVATAVATPTSPAPGPTTVAPAAPDAAEPAAPETAPTGEAPTPANEAAAALTPTAEPPAAPTPGQPRGQAMDLPAGDDGLFDRLQRVIGQGGPVAIVPTVAGLVAVSADGSRWTLLHKGKVPWAVVDERARVVWFGEVLDTPIRTENGGENGGEDDERVVVHALDMLASTLSPARISAGLPAAAIFVVAYPKRGPEGRDEQVWSVLDHGAITTLVVDAKRPRLEASGGLYMEIGLVDAAAHRAAVKAGALDKDASAFVKRIANRAGDRTNEPPRPARPDLPDRLEIPNAGCEDPDLCGTWSAWPGQPWVAVVIEHSCGDACHSRKALWHVEKKAFVALDDGPDGTLPEGDDGLAFPIVALDGSAYLEAGKLMRPGSKPWSWPMPEDVYFPVWGGGWLGGQLTLY